MPGVFAERSGVGLNLDGGDQIVDAALARGDRGDDRHAQFGAQRLQIDPQALTLGDVVHVERQNHWTPDSLQFQDQAQHQTQVGGVGDADHHVRRRLSGQAPQHGVARDLLVRAAGAQGIGARQVQHRHRSAGRGADQTLLPLHRDAGVVGHLLVRAGQGVEQGGLAAVGIADQGDTGGLQGDVHQATPRWSSLMVRLSASCRRSATRMSSTFMAMGS